MAATLLCDLTGGLQPCSTADHVVCLHMPSKVCKTWVHLLSKKQAQLAAPQPTLASYSFWNLVQGLGLYFKGQI